MKHWDEMSGRWYEHYERGRPSYPRDAVVVAGLSRSASVLELGAGTGKLTRVLAEEFANALAVEPDPRMRRWFVTRCPRAGLVGGTAEQTPIANSSVDAVFVAEAFHWFDHRRALAEIARVLRPRGTVVLMWNRPIGAPDPPITAVEELLAPRWPKDIGMPLDLDPSRFAYARDWPNAFDDSRFGPLHESRLANQQAVDRDMLVAYFGSMGWIGDLPDDEQLPLLDEVRARLDAAEYLLPFETHVHWATLEE